MRAGPGEEWTEPVLAGPALDAGWDSEEDAEMIAETVRDRSSPGVEVKVLSEGQHPDGEPRS